MDLHGWDGMGQDETTVVLFRKKTKGLVVFQGTMIMAYYGYGTKGFFIGLV